MYVGVTRPRDHLVLVLTGQSAEWLGRRLISAQPQAD